MKAADRLARQLGANIDESMGVSRTAAHSASIFPGSGPGVVHGGPDKYRGASRIKDAMAIEIDRIVADPSQPRKEFEPGALEALASSLKERGQLQPVRVRWSGDLDRWVLISGERRWRAARMAGTATLMCVEAKGEMSPDEILEDQLVENCIREDLKPVEQGRAFRTLMDRRGCSARQLADSLRVSHQAVGRALALLTLPEDLQEQVDAGSIPASAAAEVAKVDGDDVRREIVSKIIAGELTRDETVEAVRRAKGQPGRGSTSRGSKSAPRKTSATIRTAAGRLTLENRKGVDESTMLAAVLEAAEILRGRLEGRVDAA
jgi:ParB family transcriptional regulator, chromosome partitioning protein